MIRRVLTLSLLGLLVALAGCGSGVIAPKPKIAVVGPRLGRGDSIPARYKCNQNKIWLPLRWGSLPANTHELVIYIARFRPAEVAGGRQGIPVAQQLIVGLKPTLHQLLVGNLPPGALIGTADSNGKPIPICPTGGAARGFVFELYALPGEQHITKGTRGGELTAKLRAEALALGTFIATYNHS